MKAQDDIIASVCTTGESLGTSSSC